MSDEWSGCIPFVFAFLGSLLGWLIAHRDMRRIGK